MNRRDGRGANQALPSAVVTCWLPSALSIQHLSSHSLWVSAPLECREYSYDPTPRAHGRVPRVFS